MGFRGQIDEAIKYGLSAPNPLIIDLSVAEVDHQYDITGNSFYVIESPDQTSIVSVKINRRDAIPIDWMWQTGFRAPFNKLFVTTPVGQAGIMRIIIAAEDPPLFEIIDNRSAISASMNDVLTELRGDVTPENWSTEKTVGLTAISVLAANANRKAASVQSKDANTGNIYIGFDNTATTSKWVVELQPGMSWSVDDYRGPIFAISDTAAQLLGYGEW